MKIAGFIYLGMALSAFMLALHLSSVIDIGSYSYGLGLVLFVLMISLTLTLSPEKDQADG